MTRRVIRGSGCYESSATLRPAYLLSLAGLLLPLDSVARSDSRAVRQLSGAGWILPGGIWLAVGGPTL